MSLIKAIEESAASRVRSVLLPASLPLRPEEPAVDEHAQELERQVQALRAKLSDQEDDIARLGREMGVAIEEARSEARHEGRTEGEERSERALETLADGIERAIQVAAGELAALERLAVLLAQEAIGKLLGNAEEQAVLVTQVVKHQLASLETDAVLRIDVSPLDFPDEEALAELRAASARPRIEVLAIPGLQQGDCLIRLSLGVLDVSLRQQWERLSAILDDLALDGRA